MRESFFSADSSILSLNDNRIPLSSTIIFRILKPLRSINKTDRKLPRAFCAPKQPKICVAKQDRSKAVLFVRQNCRTIVEQIRRSFRIMGYCHSNGKNYCHTKQNRFQLMQNDNQNAFSDDDQIRPV
jgi:hypothetical protein